MGPMLLALWWLLRPGRQRTFALAAAALALPVTYSIFRAGYYGTLVPLPALAKSAGSAQWSRGLGFVGRFVVTYHLWVPLAGLAILLAVALKRRMLSIRERVLIAVPIVSGLALVVYVARVGGDFMHGRLLLVPTWLLVLPAMTLPLRRWTTPLLVVVAGWALLVAATTRRIDGSTRGWYADWDEREVYVEFTRHDNPIDPALFVAVTPAVRTIANAREKGLPPILVWDGNGSMTLLDPETDANVALVAGRLGTAAASVAVDEIVIDLLGLANPLGARITVTDPGHTGHEKILPAPWVLAEYGHPRIIASLPEAERIPVAAAKHALACGDLAELIASVREPMTPSRFWSNLVGAWHRTALVVPADPVEAERMFCGSN
jgi:arabinofuranosyltransferase